MRQIVLSTVAVALIAASAAQALAAQSRPHARKDTAVSEQVRKAVDQPSRPGWQYSGWSAPAGR